MNNNVLLRVITSEGWFSRYVELPFTPVRGIFLQFGKLLIDISHSTYHVESQQFNLDAGLIPCEGLKPETKAELLSQGFELEIRI